MLGSWSFPLVTNYAPDGIDIRKFLVNIQNRVVYIMIVSNSLAPTLDSIPAQNFEPPWTILFRNVCPIWQSCSDLVFPMVRAGAWHVVVLVFCWLLSVICFSLESNAVKPRRYFSDSYSILWDLVGRGPSMLRFDQWVVRLFCSLPTLKGRVAQSPMLNRYICSKNIDQGGSRIRWQKI